MGRRPALVPMPPTTFRLLLPATFALLAGATSPTAQTVKLNPDLAPRPAMRAPSG